MAAEKTPHESEESDAMTSGGSNPGEVFDVRRVRRLVELMDEYNLAEIDLRHAKQRIRLRKDKEPSPLPPMAPMAPLPVSPPTYAAPAAAAAAPAAPVESANAKFVVSPMVGTFYKSASPDAPPFVKVGDQVGPESVVCIIEAMKVFNEIPAECSGKIAAVLVENGDAVEYGQKLFRVE
jgi:acetyl-CoA carboxylase biotin carboxyl carrier protein